jgi:hypothetical protein
MVMPYNSNAMSPLVVVSASSLLLNEKLQLGRIFAALEQQSM